MPVRQYNSASQFIDDPLKRLLLCNPLKAYEIHFYILCSLLVKAHRLWQVVLVTMYQRTFV